MKKAKHEFPYLLEDRTGTIPAACPIVAVDHSFEAVRVVYKDLWPEVKIRDHAIVRAHIAKDLETSRKENTIYYVTPADEIVLRKNMAHLRYMALEFSATPEAIRLLGSFEPWTAKEEKIMAEKLKAKASAAKPDKEGLKSAAKKTPVGKGAKAPARKGNADALAKARAAKQAAAGPDNRKITVLKKDHGARAGSARAELLGKIYKAKTAQAAIDSGVKSGDVAWAARAGYIALK